MKGIGKYFSIGRKKNSLEQALRGILGSKCYAAISAFSNDKRQLVINAAKFQSVSEDELTKQIASYLDLPCILKLKPADSRFMQGSLSIENLSKAAATVISNDDGLIIGFAVYDPLLFKKTFPTLKNHALYIASFSEIERSLSSLPKQSEVIHEPQVESEEELSIEKLCLYKLFQEVLSTGGRDLTLTMTPDGCDYEFKEASGKIVEGKIYNSIVPQLKLLLEQMSSPQQFKEYSLIAAPSRGGIGYEVSEQEIVAPPLEFDEGELGHAEYTEHDLCLEDSITAEEILACFPLSHPEFEPDSSDLIYTNNESILFIEDDDSYAKILTHYFERLQIVTHRETNGKDALEGLKSGKYNPWVIVCDLHMPIMDGMEFVKKLRECELFNDIPVLMFTSEDTLDSEVEAISAGADGYIGKNESPTKLLAYIKSFLKKSQAYNITV